VGTLFVVAHLAALLGHASGHAHLGIGTNAWQEAFIAIVIFAAPVLAMILLWTRAQKTGVLMLGSAMAGAFVFGLYYHFVATGADNALGLWPGGWSTAFLVTSVLLAAIEAFGAAWSFWVLHGKRNYER
jgi:amino acid permease